MRMIVECSMLHFPMLLHTMCIEALSSSDTSTRRVEVFANLYFEAGVNFSSMHRQHRNLRTDKYIKDTNMLTRPHTITYQTTLMYLSVEASSSVVVRSASPVLDKASQPCEQPGHLY